MPPLAARAAAAPGKEASAAAAAAEAALAAAAEAVDSVAAAAAGCVAVTSRPRQRRPFTEKFYWNFSFFAEKPLLYYFFPPT